MIIDSILVFINNLLMTILLIDIIYIINTIEHLFSWEGKGNGSPHTGIHRNKGTRSHTGVIRQNGHSVWLERQVTTCVVAAVRKYIFH